MVLNAASNKLESPINVITENLICDDRPVAILNVPQGENKPYTSNRAGYPIPVTSINDVDMFFFKEFYEREFGIFPKESTLPIEKLLINLKLPKNNNLTLSDFLLFGKKPERIKPSL